MPKVRLGVGIGRQPVVQVEEHGRTSGGGHEQILEPPEGVEAKSALVFPHHELDWSLAGKDVEVVEPEVEHDLFELPFGESGAKNLGRLQLRDHLPGRPLEACQFGKALHHLLPFRAPGPRVRLARVVRSGRCSGLRRRASLFLHLGPRLLDLLAQAGGDLVPLTQLPGGQGDRLQRGQPGLQAGIAGKAGGKLSIDP
jgi:hypothetical protein